MFYIKILLSLLIAFYGLKYTIRSIFWVMQYNINHRQSFDMVFLRICIPKKESQQDKESSRDESGGTEDSFRKPIKVMSQLFAALDTIGSGKWKTMWKGQDYLSFEIAAIDGLINFYVVCPAEMTSLIEKQVTGFFPDCFIEYDETYNIFKPKQPIVANYLYLKKDSHMPLNSFENMSADPLNYICNSLSKFGANDGAAIQIMIRPGSSDWQDKGRKTAKDLLNEKKDKSVPLWQKPFYYLGKILDVFVHGTDKMDSGSDDSASVDRKTQIEEEEIKLIDAKSRQIGFDTVLRVVVTSDDSAVAKDHMNNIKSAFGQYATAYNSIGELKHNKSGYILYSPRSVVKNYILRAFRKPLLHTFKEHTMCADELASIFHIPSIRYNKSPNINWTNYKVAPPPSNLPTEGILLGHNIYRGQKKEIRMKPNDRMRHFYVIGQTGTGKSSMMTTMIRQDLKNGHGVCVIDPHGELVEELLPFVPRERADDVIYFNPADTERPMGLNLLEAETPEERDLVAMDAMNLMIKMFDEEIFGPRIQDYFRNGCLTLMEYENGGALTDIVRLFTDDAFQKVRREQVTNPIVKSFWDNQMAKTSAEEQQRIIPYFAAKFAAFITNTMMRNIIGQTKSGFDFSKVMNEGKILFMNLSKGLVGDFNSQLLGLIIVSKLQMAALRRQKLDPSQRKDFFLYIDEFQNYITDSIESILSEARKYRLSLNLGHQYIGQLVQKNDEKIKNAVFGNVGTMMTYKIGATDAEFLQKEFAPTFSDQDLINIDKFKAVMKLSIDTQPSKPFSIIPLNPHLDKGDPTVGNAYKQLSRLKYGRDVEFVSREILRRIG